MQPGVTTLYLYHKAEEFIRYHGGITAFLVLYNFPNTLCVSTNEQIVHGIPNKKPLYEGDIVGS
ncbi:MAG: M24 family metallopeptidase [Candidatus Walczuchella monophlebidarum]